VKGVVFGRGNVGLLFEVAAVFMKEAVKSHVT